MSDKLPCRSGMSLELSGTSDEAEEKICPTSISSPSSSSSSSSSSWLRRQNRSCGVSSESETSLEYPETPVSEEFKECTLESRNYQTLEEVSLASVTDSLSLDASNNTLPSVSPIQRRPGYYGCRGKEERAKLRAEKIAVAAANRALPASFVTSTPAAPHVTVSVTSSYLDKVVQETVDTEKIYVKDLKDIIRGYLLPFAKSSEIQIPREDLHALFGNIKAIYKFNRRFLENLKKRNLDPVNIGKCFVAECDGFKVYADYCTNYPRSLETLSRYSLDQRFVVALKHLQKGLSHPLPLQTYLFKPIQRILKYHLLLKNIVSHHNESSPGHGILVQAHASMMDVANHLNEMKRNQERRTEIQRLLFGSNGMDLSSFGDLILEDKFNMSGLRDVVHWAFLFRKGLLIAKKRRDDQLQIKTTIMCSNLMLVESIPREPLSFHVLPFDSPKTQYTLQARNLDQKQRWCREIKTLMLDSYNVAIPEKARQLLMRTGNSHQEQDRHFEIPKRHLAPEYLERRRLRRQSISSISGNNGRSWVDNLIPRLDVAGRSSENLLSIRNEDARSKGSRSRPLRVDSGLCQKGERRSQSLDSLRNVEQEPICQAVKSEKKQRSEREEERGCKSEQQTKGKQSEEKRTRESVKPQEGVEIRKCRSGSRDDPPNSLGLQKEKEKTFEYKEEHESGLRCLKEKQYANEYKEDLTKRLLYEDEKRNERIDVKVYEGEKTKERISMNVLEDEERNESQRIETEYRQGIGENLTVPTAEEAENGASDRCKDTRGAVLRASSFRKAMELNRIDSLVVKRSKIQVRRKRSEDPQDIDEEQDSSESNDEAVLSNYQPKLLPIFDQKSSYHGDDSVVDLEQQSLMRYGQADPCITEKWSGICDAFGVLDENRGSGDNSRHSSISILSTTFDSLGPAEFLSDVTQESFVDAEKSFKSTKHQEIENSGTKEIISGRIDVVHENADNSSQARESSHCADAQEQRDVDPSIEFFDQVISTPQKADRSTKVGVTDQHENPGDRGDIASMYGINSGALRNVLKEVERFSPAESSRSNCNTPETNDSSHPDHVMTEHDRVLDNPVPELTKSVNAQFPALKPGRHSDAVLQRVLDDSTRDDLKEVSVRYCSSLPSLNGHVTNETCNSSAHRSIIQAAAECRALVHSRILSSSDMTGYFSASKVLPAVQPSGVCSSASGSASSVRMASGSASSVRMASGLDQIRRSDNAVGGSEEQDATGQFKETSETDKISLSSEEHDLRIGTTAETANDAGPTDSLLVPQPVAKCRNRGKMVFEKVSSPNVPGIGVTSQLQDVDEHQRQDEAKTETSSPVTENKFAAKSKIYQENTGKNVCYTGDSPLRSPSGSEGVFQQIPFGEFARRFDRRHTYVYRLARAYSSRVKQLQKEAALYQKASKSSTKRPLRKWLTVDGGTAQQEQHSSCSDTSTRDNVSVVSQNGDNMRLAENNLEVSEFQRSRFSASSSSFQSARNLSSAAKGWRPVSESRTKARGSGKHGKPFGFSFDALPEFCFSRSVGESDSEDCFEEVQENSKDASLVKQRVQHFENSTESSC